MYLGGEGKWGTRPTGRWEASYLGGEEKAVRCRFKLSGCVRCGGVLILAGGVLGLMWAGLVFVWCERARE